MYREVAVLLGVLLFVLRCCFWLRRRLSFVARRADEGRGGFGSEGRVRVLTVLGSGGHTAEMLMLLRDMDLRNKVSLGCVLADTDKFSMEKALAAFSESLQVSTDRVGDYVRFYRIKRSREVGQSYVNSVFTTLVSMVDSVGVLLWDKYDLIIVNGPGTCIPICFGSLLLEVSQSWHVGLGLAGPGGQEQCAGLPRFPGLALALV
ncbi:secreted glycosyltransferase [Cryptosporidium canis]|uniref:UDP-N-acetylglucosamine transferase subunit ALG14 n=1 Tax=Cryptosporidium canis TaxID=195482 RepID=A0ABQ8PA57_9CRYT|nr:secreted glycosyltransferase [Cryptosporidium canis]KAJ1614178.1 secreted glycosyltransferase [Cryptosporidium canis]